MAKYTLPSFDFIITKKRIDMDIRAKLKFVPSELLHILFQFDWTQRYERFDDLILLSSAFFVSPVQTMSIVRNQEIKLLTCYHARKQIYKSSRKKATHQA